MREKGTHTWDLYLTYHRCPKCGLIFENRENYIYRLGKYQKDLVCPRCANAYTLTKNQRLRFGPFFGDSSKPEFDWS